MMDSNQAVRVVQAEPSSLRVFLRQNSLLAYFVLAYALSWIFTIPCILVEWGGWPDGLFGIFFLIKAFAGPFVAAFIMTGVVGGKAGLAQFRARFRQVRAGWGWYLFILLVIPALFVIGLFVQPGVLASFQGVTPRFVIYYLVNFVVIFFGGGPLAEEPGWRGFALPRMQSRFGALGGTLLLGLIWGLWHLPDFLTRAQGGGPGTGWGTFFTNFPIFVLLVVALAVVMTWVYNRTRGSIFIAILLHASINTTGVIAEIFPAKNLSSMTMLNTAMLVVVGGLALLIVLFTRGRLGYSKQPPQD